MKILYFFLLSFFIACQSPRQSPGKVITVESVVNDSLIDLGDVQAIIDPVWWTADIYQTHDVYKNSLAPFSENQRFVFAIQWYQAEINNGGHEQFFYNSTGIVWEDMLNGFKKMGLSDYYAIAEDAVNKFPTKPDFERVRRISQLESLKLDFEDLDTRFYNLDTVNPLQMNLIRFIEANKKDFYFHGPITRPIDYP